ncbi:hypothetical protein [Paraburkholderia azotifigens]|uniref:Uncharacterized protein n=1 Tax=Paraburkholderia azotifigens TaxID=2057004 RepID=A0A5C6VFN4_9BURK|nr:hypothetical protein [Paraburkholderia azotifigens]TXC84123.1 hypothetical protein FRZ40_27840 [Paraburkholderia azotifigens]
MTAYAEHVTPPALLPDLRALQLVQLDARQWNHFDWQEWFAQFDVKYQIPHDAIAFNQVTLRFNVALEGLGFRVPPDAMQCHVAAVARTVIELFFRPIRLSHRVIAHQVRVAPSTPAP